MIIKYLAAYIFPESCENFIDVNIVKNHFTVNTNSGKIYFLQARDIMKRLVTMSAAYFKNQVFDRLVKLAKIYIDLGEYRLSN